MGRFSEAPYGSLLDESAAMDMVLDSDLDPKKK